MSIFNFERLLRVCEAILKLVAYAVRLLGPGDDSPVDDPVTED